ncbi:Eco57I restriction-modification methylase domain-containing protein [Natrinema sp. J7-2]|uniref:Eco57I restriction-modification methylase domain-containing protein n=1 Tax=Natrinema sp. (strain J7-2) TaxID=406552 RepID=UPI00026D51CD|nr:N-6 DNA methylase [Natrinema sp. J7-2]AFO56719.1 type i restriction-modification system methyltransferase subunit [Natrinema sp. J7-2]
MPDAAAVHDSLRAIADSANDDMSERDVENLFLEQGFYDALDYEGTGTDLRSEFTLPDNRRPDYITLDTNEAVTAVYEFKTTGRDLPPNEDQLFHYMDHLRAEYGVLTNGEMLRLYRRGDDRPMLVVSLESVTESEVRDLVSALQKREFDLTDPEDVNQFLERLEPVPLDEQAELGQEHFFDTFRLEEDSPFADLIIGMMDLLHELRDEREEKFVKGAYDFWEATYASEPDETPDSWEPFIDGTQSLRDFMFCLESGHALLARLLLAKATEDHDFFAGTGYDGMDDYFRGLQGFSDSINLDAFPVAADNLIDDMQEQLVEGLFQDDIFVWWTDGYVEQLTRGHKTGPNQFEAVAEGTGKVERISEATRDRFSRAVAEVFFNVLRFDFEHVEGDLLGDLYQRYFDPETRKALGEFYTPQPVIDYIMDGVDYNRGVSNDRLIDPSCGSGTFLVEAVERYIADIENYEDDPNWEEHLRKLCTRPRIVGLDIHPFAVLMAQIRFVVAILPAYRKAKQQNPSYTIRRLPIYRTDTLRNERELTGVDIGDDSTRQLTFDSMTEDEQDVRIPVPLPVEVDEDEVAETEDGFLVRRVRMPLFDTIQLETGVSNFGEYFAALQGVLDTVKAHMRLAEEFGDEYDWTYQSGLEERINHYTSQEYDGVEDFFEPYVNDMLENVRYLKEEHNDGRLFKMFEDTVLALVVKNYMEYDYVVGNPPYVSSQNIPDEQKEMLDSLYPDSAIGQYDLYCPFFDRSLEWLDEGDRLGFITPNQFMVANYGKGVRKLIQDNTAVKEIQDFRDSGVFRDATNYPVITVLQIESDEEVRERNSIRCGRVKSNIDAESGRELDEKVVETIREEYDNPGYSDDYVDIFDYPQSRLSETRWPVMPEYEWQVFKKIESEADQVVGEVTDAVFQGIMTGKKGVYIVDVLDADIVTASNSGSTVTISPTGSEEEYEIETDVLRPFIDGKEVERWQVTWGGLHIVHPYQMEETGDDEATAELIDEDTLSSELPLTLDYLEDHKEELSNRSSLGDKEWYEYSRPQNLERFERPKLILSKIADEATYMSDTEGTWYFTTPYSVLLDEDRGEIAQEMTAQLNSKVLDYYFKHISAVKAGGFYEYLNQYITPVPCMVEADDGEFTAIRGSVEQILSTLHTENKTDRFPEAYLGDYDGELDYITYEWQTRRYPVNADVQADVDDNFTVQAGRSDTINDPAMYSDDRDARKRRAEYVHAAVDGRNVKSGEEMTIPIPRSDAGVEELLDRLEADRDEVNQTDIEELEAEIDDAVYDLFDLTADERAVVEDYLEVF